MGDMNLIQTVDLMVSENYKERFVAEYLQLNIRLTKLKTVIDKYHQGKLDFELSCPIELLEEQYNSMLNYKSILEKRAEIEEVNINLDNFFDDLVTEK